jgi:hypothetical protein
MENVMSEQCENCRYFFDVRPAEFEGSSRAEFHGYCRRTPPTVVQQILAPEQPSSVAYKQPIVGKQDWCGEYESSSG